jgi:hypothetical protein
MSDDIYEFPPLPQIKKIVNRRQAKTRIANTQKKKEAKLSNVVEIDEKNAQVTIKVTEPTVSLEFLSEMQQKAQAALENREENIIFKPNPGPQTTFLAATEKEVFYGGARGGGAAANRLGGTGGERGGGAERGRAAGAARGGG